LVGHSDFLLIEVVDFNESCKFQKRNIEIESFSIEQGMVDDAVNFVNVSTIEVFRGTGANRKVFGSEAEGACEGSI
jgi:hypothetical protein